MAKKAVAKNLSGDLERIIAHLDTLYEQGEDCIHPDTGIVVTDGEYDAMRRQLKSLRPDSPLFHTATASKLDSGAQKIKHDPPLTSIEKASHEDVETQEEMLFKWLSDREAELPDQARQGKRVAVGGKSYKGTPVRVASGVFYQAYKLDGVAMGLYYEQGKLKAAGLRPRDGVNGEDVTRQAVYVEGIPKQLNKKVTCSIRGEVICRLSEFEKVQEELAAVGEKLRANPRNHAAGGIRQFKDPKKTAKMRLSFIAYGIERLDHPPYQTEIERARWCQEELGVPFVETTEFRFEDLAKMEAAANSLDFEVDGVIIGVNDLEDQEQLGRHGDPVTGNPKGKIAWKFREEEATPVITDIQWQTGRTGKIVGVAVFDGVRLAGTNVTRATLHNAGFMKRNRIGVGSQIGVRKAGKIIPKVVRVVGGQKASKFPKKCPSCGQAAELVEGAVSKSGEQMLELVCSNSGDCPAQNVSGLVHYLSNFGVLGLGESRVAQLIDGGAVSSPADFYRLDVERCLACGLSKRQSLLAIAGVHMIPNPDKQENEDLERLIAEARKTKKSIPLWKLFATFGIESAGKSAGKALQDHFQTMDKIRAATVAQLAEVTDVGEKTAQMIHDYLAAHGEEIDDLLRYVEPEKLVTGALTGLIFCFSGGFEAGKRHWEQQVEQRGGRCAGSVSKTTNYLVAGPGSGSKSEKAEKLGIPILTVEQLEKML